MGIRQFPSDKTPVWTRGSSSISEPDERLFHGLGPILETGSFMDVRITLEVRQHSGNIKVTAAYVLSDDGINWGSPVELSGPYLDDDGLVVGDWIATLNEDIDGNLFVRFGVNAINVRSSVKIESCNVGLRVDTRTFTMPQS